MNENSLLDANLALVALGGNLPSSAGRPETTLRQAVARLTAESGIDLIACSRFWRSPAWPPGSGPDYVNAAVAMHSRHGPETMLAILHRIEADLGRRRDGGRWQARGIDLDLIAWGDAVRPDADVQDAWRTLSPDEQQRRAPDRLILPHPRMQDRGFVLAPLAEIAPGWCHPRLGLSVAQMLAALPEGALEGMEVLNA